MFWWFHSFEGKFLLSLPVFSRDSDGTWENKTIKLYKKLTAQIIVLDNHAREDFQGSPFE